MQETIPEYTVSEISFAIKRTMEDAFARVRVRGEIFGCKRADSGHYYLSLKDENANLSAVCWKGVAAGLKVKPEDGLEVVAAGRITTFAGKSSYQLVIEQMEVAGAGNFHLLDYQLVAAFAGKSGDASGGDDFKAVFGFDFETGGHAFPADGGKVGVFVFERKVIMSGIRSFAAEDFASDAYAGKGVFHCAFNGERNFADGIFRYRFLHVLPLTARNFSGLRKFPQALSLRPAKKIFFAGFKTKLF